MVGFVDDHQAETTPVLGSDVHHALVRRDDHPPGERWLLTAGHDVGWHGLREVRPEGGLKLVDQGKARCQHQHLVAWAILQPSTDHAGCDASLAEAGRHEEESAVAPRGDRIVECLDGLGLIRPRILAADWLGGQPDCQLFEILAVP